MTTAFPWNVNVKVALANHQLVVMVTKTFVPKILASNVDTIIKFSNCIFEKTFCDLTMRITWKRASFLKKYVALACYFEIAKPLHNDQVLI